MIDERGLNESIGFLFVFALVVTMAGIVYTTGFADLQHTRDFEQANNAERGFEILASNLEDVSERGAPSRGTELEVADAHLYTGQPVPTTVTVVDSDDPENNDSISTAFEPIVYETDEHAVIYSSGAVFRAGSDWEVMVREPAFSISDERVLIPVIRTHTGGEGESAAGTQPVLVRALNDHSDGIPNVIRPPEDAESYDVNLTMETERAELWKEYFEEEGFDCSESDVENDELECTIEGVDHAQVSSLRVLVVFE